MYCVVVARAVDKGWVSPEVSVTLGITRNFLFSSVPAGKQWLVSDSPANQFVSRSPRKANPVGWTPISGLARIKWASSSMKAPSKRN